MDALTLGLSSQSQPTDMATLGISWGDGTGTGAVGTFNLVSPDIVTYVVKLNIWKGIWTLPVLSFSPN